MIELDRKNFEEEVEKAEGYVFVDFWGQTCEPCKALMPGVHELAEKYKDNMKFCSLDIGKGRRVAIKCGVLGLPAMGIFKDGEKVDGISGNEITLKDIEELIKKYI